MWGEIMKTAPRGFSRWASSCKTNMNNTQWFLWLEEQYPPGYIKLPKDSDRHLWRIFPLQNLAQQHQAHAPPGWVTFAQSENEVSSKTVPWKYGISFSDFTWYHFQEMGHYVGNCPSSTDNAHANSQSLQVGLTMTQTTINIPATDIINTNCIIFDTCSTIRSIIKKDLVQDGCRQRTTGVY